MSKIINQLKLVFVILCHWKIKGGDSIEDGRSEGNCKAYYWAVAGPEEMVGVGVWKDMPLLILAVGSL